MIIAAKTGTGTKKISKNQKQMFLIYWGMWIAIISGLIVSIDALFIGVSFGSQKRCRYWHLLVINAVLIGLCFLGYGLGIWIGDRVDIELDIVIGILFILLGSWTIIYYFAFERRRAKKTEKQADDEIINDVVFEFQKKPCNKNIPSKNTIITGVLMSVEAMFITIGLTLILDTTTFLIPLTVGLAHFVYCTATFFLAKYLRRLPPMVGPIVAGASLIVYGIMAFFL